MESASAVSDAPSDASPSVLRESKKPCVRGGCLSLMSAAGGVRSALAGARLGLGRELAGADSVDERSATEGFADADSADERSAAVAVAGEIVAFVVAALGASGSAAELDRSDFDDAGVASATAALVSAIGADAVESDAEGVAGVEAEAGVVEAGLGEEDRGPRSSVAEADNLKSANTMAHAMANLTQSPCT